MSIPRPEAGLSEGAAAPLGESFDTALIARLANEFFSASQGSAPATPERPERLPTRPSVPHSVAGLPSLGELAPAGPAYAPSTPVEPSSHPGLPGGFASTEPSAPPPVHPPFQSSVTQPRPVSGGHDPACSESYAFGEPRCKRTALGGSPVTSTQRAERGYPDTTSETGALPGYENISAPHYYFEQPQGGRSAPGHRASAASTPSLAALDIEAVRRDFPALNQRVNGQPLIWLDNAATTHKPQAVIDATSRFYGRDNSNIHRAAHTLAARSTELFENGREKVRQFLGAASTDEIVFVRGTTEAINLVAQSYGRKNIGAGDEIILTTLEHHANIVPWQILAGQTGAVIRPVPINDRGELILEEYAKLLSPRTKFVAVTHVSNALGTINPVEEIIALAHGYGVPVLVDGAQSTPHLPINVQALDADFYVFSGHKVFGPTGIGALYGKAALLKEMPPWQGGGHMIRGVSFEQTIYQDPPEKFEAGTPDIAGVVGLGAAIDYLLQLGIPGLAAYEHSLLAYATSALATVPGIRPIGTAGHKASVFGFVIPGVDNSKIAKHLDQHGIAVRAGHHCAMPAVRHFGVESTVRPSLAFYNTFAEVDALISALHRLPRK